MTTLKDEILALIRQEGPISVARYMELGLGHPRLGYYMTRDPFGAAGDFTTAPEISQMFGELIGLCFAEVWTTVGSPPRAIFAEAGPGRGTLMADMLRAARVIPGFRDALEVHLIETSPVLRAAQARTLAAAGVSPVWHEGLETLPSDAPLLLAANEFLDALPVRQFVRQEGRWHERLVGEAEGQFAFGLSAEPEASPLPPGPDDATFEVSPAGLLFASGLARRISSQSGAAILIDYGHVRSGFGGTLQALRGHAFADPLDAPGEADLTAHVDFEAVSAAARQGGAAVQGPVTQGDFLRSLGIAQRVERLIAGASVEKATAISSQFERLTDMNPRGMGALFKVMAITPVDAPVCSGFR